MAATKPFDPDVPVSDVPVSDAPVPGVPVTITDLTIPVLEERLHIEKRQVTTGLAKVHVTVSERDEAVEALLTRQDVVVDRVPVGTFVTDTPAVRQDGDTIIVPIYEERLVVEKRLFLMEELRIRIDEKHQATTQVVRLRREHAEVDMQPNTQGT